MVVIELLRKIAVQFIRLPLSAFEFLLSFVVHVHLVVDEKFVVHVP